MPHPHGLPEPSGIWSISAADRATLAQYAPLGRSSDSCTSTSGEVVEDITLPDSYLDNVFVVQADSGASCHMMHKNPPPGRQTSTIGDRRKLRVKYIGNIDVVFHGTRIQSELVAHGPENTRDYLRRFICPCPYPCEYPKRDGEATWMSFDCE